MSISERAPATDSVSWEMTPGEQPDNWNTRWKVIQRLADEVTGPQSASPSADAIHDAASRLYDFFSKAYHLKDHLKADSTVTSAVTGQQIEDAITNSPDLALLADLANTDKHAVLNRTPRSGDAPVFKRCHAASGDDGDWVLRVEMQHQGQVIDATAFAKRVIPEWEAHLRRWSQM